MFTLLHHFFLPILCHFTISFNGGWFFFQKKDHYGERKIHIIMIYGHKNQGNFHLLKTLWDIFWDTLCITKKQEKGKFNYSKYCKKTNNLWKVLRWCDNTLFFSNQLQKGFKQIIPGPLDSFPPHVLKHEPKNFMQNEKIKRTLKLKTPVHMHRSLAMSSSHKTIWMKQGVILKSSHNLQNKTWLKHPLNIE